MRARIGHNIKEINLEFLINIDAIDNGQMCVGTFGIVLIL